MSETTPAERFHQMLLRCDEALAKLEYFHVTKNVWENNPFVRDSFLVSVAQVGEEVSKIGVDTCHERFPDIDWREIKGMRNIIVHVYAKVDYDIVWEVLHDGIPEIRKNASLR